MTRNHPIDVISSDSMLMLHNRYGTSGMYLKGFDHVDTHDIQVSQRNHQSNDDWLLNYSITLRTAVHVHYCIHANYCLIERGSHRDRECYCSAHRHIQWQ